MISKSFRRHFPTRLTTTRLRLSISCLVTTVFIAAGCSSNSTVQVDESEEDKSLQEVKQDALDDLNQSAVEDYVSLVKGLRDDDLPDDKIIATEKENVKKQLKDAKSARFKDLKLVTHKGAKFLCGKVNAKNSFGGYAGYTDFVSYSLVRFSNNRNGKVIVDGICFN